MALYLLWCVSISAWHESNRRCVPKLRPIEAEVLLFVSFLKVVTRLILALMHCAGSWQSHVFICATATRKKG